MPPKKKKRKPEVETGEGPLAPGMQETKEIRKSQMRREEPESHTFTPGETGQPEQDAVPGIENPQGVQGGRGPLRQEGEGNRQNDELAELEEVEPSLAEKK
jgi:hypothetical protein